MEMQNYRLSIDNPGLELALYILVVAGVLWLCWKLSKFVSKKVGNTGNTSNIRILERVSLAPDKGLVIAEICGACYLLSFSNERVEILMKLDENYVKKPPAAVQQNFKDLMSSALRGKWGMTGNDRNNNSRRP